MAIANSYNTFRFDEKIILDKAAKEFIFGIRKTYMEKPIGNYGKSPLRASGEFGRALEYKVDENSLTISITGKPAKYIDYLIKGQSPSEASAEPFEDMYSGILKWIDAKGIQPRNGETKQEMAWKFTEVIRKYGTSIWDEYRNGDTGLISDTINERSVDEIKIALSDDLYYKLRTELTENFKRALSL